MLWPGGGGGGGGAGALFMLLAPRLTTIKWRHGQFNNDPTIYPKHNVSKKYMKYDKYINPKDK